MNQHTEPEYSRPLKRSQLYAAVVDRSGMTNPLDRALSALADLNAAELDVILSAMAACGVGHVVAGPAIGQPPSDIPKPILDALALCRTKSQDYNAVVGRDAYFPLGLPSYAHEIYKKGLRLINLSSTKAQPNHESVRDTALDLINYSTFLAEAVDKGTVLP